ncbi:MAG: GNAT family N-acetyltransferase [Chloroflexi bacterium]|nr:GNAT family N-acetyltransferase [Chloroflexota bacterium]
MSHLLSNHRLRPLEPRDLDSLYRIKNDPEVTKWLGGFSTGYAMADLAEWLESHRGRRDEVLWAIAQTDSDVCVGHVGLYSIDQRVRVADFGILLSPTVWGKGLGTECSRFAVEYGFDALNLNRIQLRVLTTNQRAIRLYHSLGFRDEGCLREAQFRSGQYLDVLLMGLLRSEYGVDHAV